MNVTVLVDFDNDSVRTALEVAAALGPKLWGVRLDTSEQLVDRSLFDEMGGFTPTGVNPRLVEKVRGALDGAGFGDVKIVASGGFTAERIREFEALGVPVDAYGVGSSLIRGNNDFTADVVLLDGQPVRQGRALVFAEPAPAARHVGGEEPPRSPLYCHEWSQKYAIDAVIGQPTNRYGPYPTAHASSRLASLNARSPLAARPAAGA